MSATDPPAQRQPRAEWYSAGLRFECTQCGACCTGSPGYVAFTEEEARGMASRLGLSV
ncbi:MAG: YkgJ family cysteine cluster protein, partial [Planctomycetota bacterium]